MLGDNAAKEMIVFTPTAKEEILRAFQSPDIPAGYALRVGMKGGACSGSYLLGLDKASENDEVHDIEGVQVVIDRRHLMYVIGAKIDYTQTDAGAGFVIMKE